MDNQAAAPAQHRTTFVTSARIRNETWNYLCNLTIMLMLGILLSCTASTAAAPADNRAVRENSSGTGGVQILKRAAPDVAAITAGLVLGRDTTTKDVTTAAAAGTAPMQNPSTDMTSDQPQGQCLLDGEYVPETTVFCEKQIGCRAIQKTGYCCPDYKCDCEKDGITYANGDKLVDPETPCTVCYCQGGEILCSSVTCFHRDDCTPKYIAGVCCPEYDNCPVAASETAVNNTFSATSTTTMKPEISNGILSQKITIKEITKPIEIRITDDNKAIPIPQILKPAATVMTTTHTTTTTTTGAAATVAVAADTTAIPPSTTTTTITTMTPTPTPSSKTIITTTTTIPAHEEKSPITNMNAINIETPTSNNTHNNLLEINVPTKLMAVSTDNNQNNRNKANGGESLKLTASVAYSSIEQQQPATNLNEGSREMDDSVPSLSVFASQGSSQDPTKVNIKREYLVNTNNTNTQASDGNNNNNNNDEAHDAKSLYNHKIENGKETEEMLQTNGENSEELDSDTAGSDNIYHIVLTTDGPRVRSTTEDSILEKFPLPEQPNNESAMDKYTMNAFNKSSIETILQHHNHMEEDDNIVVAESNPAYPSLPEDDFSLRDVNFQLSDSDDLSYEPNSVALGGAKFDMIKNITTVEDNHYDGGSGLLMDELIAVSSTAERKNGPNLHKSIISDSLIKEKVNRKLQTTVQLIDSAEDSLPDNINVITDHEKKPEKIERKEVSSLGENGSGAGEIITFNNKNKNNTERESTTAKSNKRLDDIDGELSDGSGDGKSLVNDPKWDAESIKLEENQGHSPVSTLDNASSNDVSSDNA